MSAPQESSVILDMSGDGDNGAESESLNVEVEEILGLVAHEINRRLKAGRVRDIADGTLFRYHENLSKWVERNKKNKEEVKEDKSFNLLDQIKFLPTDRAVELLEEEIKNKESDLKKHKSTLKGLKKNATQV